MLTFADRDTAEEWWKLVSAEYPDTVRSNPQLFSFTGDGKPSQIWSNKKFEQLKKFLYLDEAAMIRWFGILKNMVSIQLKQAIGG